MEPLANCSFGLLAGRLHSGGKRDWGAHAAALKRYVGHHVLIVDEVALDAPVSAEAGSTQVVRISGTTSPEFPEPTPGAEMRSTTGIAAHLVTCGLVLAFATLLIACPGKSPPADAATPVVRADAGATGASRMVPGQWMEEPPLPFLPKIDSPGVVTMQIGDIATGAAGLLQDLLVARDRTRRADLAALVARADLVIVASAFSNGPAPDVPHTDLAEPQGPVITLADRRPASARVKIPLIRLPEETPEHPLAFYRQKWPLVLFLKAVPGSTDVELLDPDSSWLKADPQLIERVKYRVRESWTSRPPR